MTTIVTSGKYRLVVSFENRKIELYENDELVKTDVVDEKNFYSMLKSYIQLITKKDNN